MSVIVHIVGRCSSDKSWPFTANNSVTCVVIEKHEIHNLCDRGIRCKGVSLLRTESLLKAMQVYTLCRLNWNPANSTLQFEWKYVHLLSRSCIGECGSPWPAMFLLASMCSIIHCNVSMVIFATILMAIFKWWPYLWLELRSAILTLWSKLIWRPFMCIIFVHYSMKKLAQWLR